MLGPNAQLIGVSGSRRRLSTPALLLDLDALERNLDTMARHCRDVGMNCRPHVKGHKSGRVGREQIDRGAIGLSCATLGEAEAMARAGVSGLLITSPMVTDGMIERLVALNRATEGLLATVDNPANVTSLAAAARASAKSLGVLVDFDVGQRRTGAVSEAAAVDLARAVAHADGLEYRGVQAYYGHLQAIQACADRKAAAMVQIERLRALRDALAGAGLVPAVVSGGGTGTFDIDYLGKAFTEIQPGSYALMDAPYSDVALSEDRPSRFEVALFVQGTVVSTNHPGQVTVNAGMKALATDGPGPRVATGAPAECGYTIAGDEHGIVAFPDAETCALSIGDVIEWITPHCDTTTNLYDVFHCVREDTLVDIWPIDGRCRW